MKRLILKERFRLISIELDSYIFFFEVCYHFLFCEEIDLEKEALD